MLPFLFPLVLCCFPRQHPPAVQSRGRGQCGGALQRGARGGAGPSHCGGERHTPGEHSHSRDCQGLRSSSWWQTCPRRPYLRGKYYKVNEDCAGTALTHNDKYSPLVCMGIQEYPGCIAWCLLFSIFLHKAPCYCVLVVLWTQCFAAIKVVVQDKQVSPWLQGVVNIARSNSHVTKSNRSTITDWLVF